MSKQEINEKIKQAITGICETNRKRYGRQYPVTKWARVKLQELGLWEMFSKISRSYKGDPGQSDAQDVLAAVEESVELAGIDDVVVTGGSIGRLLKQLKQAEQAESDDDGSGTGTIDDDLFTGVDEGIVQNFLMGGQSELTIDDMPAPAPYGPVEIGS